MVLEAEIEDQWTDKVRNEEAKRGIEEDMT
jgi:hypothetical protein